MTCVALGLGACQSERAAPALEELLIEKPRDHFSRAGFFEMVPPLRNPVRSRGHRVEVWLRIPEGGRISTRLVDGRPQLELPAGSEAARVERIAVGNSPETWEFGVADVRGTRFGQNGEVFYVLRPTSADPDAPLRGYAWSRDSREGQQRATSAIIELVGASLPPKARAREESAARKSNACAGCHQHGRPPNDRPRQHGIANRATDGSGCYQVQGVLASHAPVEDYFPVQGNLDDPFVSFDCGAAPAHVERTAGRIRCDDGSVPRGRLDVRSALAASDPHALGVCDSRRYLHEHLDDAGRQGFRDAFAECGIAPSSR